MTCIKTVEVLVPDRVVAVEVRVPGRIQLVEVQIPGLPGPPADGAATSVVMQRTAGVALSGHRVVRASSSSEILVASADDLTHADSIIGISGNAAALGGSVAVTCFGFITESSWAFNPGLNVFVGINGAITQVAPTLPTSLYLRVIGVAVSPDTIFVDLGTVIELI